MRDFNFNVDFNVDLIVRVTCERCEATHEYESTRGLEQRAASDFVNCVAAHVVHLDGHSSDYPTQTVCVGCLTDTEREQYEALLARIEAGTAFHPQYLDPPF